MTVQARRQSSAYNTSSPYSSRANDAIDLEKQPSHSRRDRHNLRPSPVNSDSESDSPPPVVATSYQQAQQQPMLGPSTLRRSRAGMGFRVPNRIMRWLCLALFAGLILFIITLFRFTFFSSITNVGFEL